jgi:N utilization substance protein A
MIMTARVGLGWVDLADIEADAAEDDDADAEGSEA